MYAKYIKRIIDFILSFIAVIVFSPLLLVIAVLVKINLGAPVIFKQERIGLNEKIFTMYKFRTMNDKRDKNGELLPDIYRQTRLGDFLRSTSLDELPELINILKGDIAIVGPRPLLVSYLPYYTEEERLRHSVRGGLTVPEVVYGDVAPTWEEQFSYEVDYTKNISFLLDIKIIWNTVKIIFKRVENDYGSQVRNPLNVERSDWARK
ncbi:sugar transferase [Sporofaciens musculi]|jgi:lipopolysaccharide/colanic/teichoic acid biosynthesis glycosyltransferase|uniref:sugar transferase n=1 Tax=Sporofaciens musculi TaxID=2681861 RepID=UPI00258B09FB|nr:sugar transferase [Sporofaciens musculi]